MRDIMRMMAQRTSISPGIRTASQYAAAPCKRNSTAVKNPMVCSSSRTGAPCSTFTRISGAIYNCARFSAT